MKAAMKSLSMKLEEVEGDKRETWDALATAFGGEDQLRAKVQEFKKVYVVGSASFTDDGVRN